MGNRSIQNYSESIKRIKAYPNFVLDEQRNRSSKRVSPML